MSHRATRLSSIVLAAALAAGLTPLAACDGGARVSGVLLDGVRTHLEPKTITAGGVAGVACEPIGADRSYFDFATAFTVTPDLNVTATAETVSATIAGTYLVRCAVPELGVVDPEGATLTVTAGKPVSVRPVFDDNPVDAGVWTGVRCAAVDQYGNPTPIDGTVHGDPPLQFNGGQVMSEVAGSFEATCESAEYPSLPREPGVLVVTPGDAVGVELRTDPDRTAVLVDAVLRFYWVVVDAYGNAYSDAAGTFTPAAAPSVVELDAAERRYRFTEEGRFTFRVDLHAPWEGMSDELTIAVDSTGPEIVITFPERGATLAGAGQPVVVTGTVTDTFAGVDAFTINGDPVTVGAGGAFSHPLPPGWGVNLIDARATDTAGNAAKLTPTFQYSAGYLPFVDSSAQGLKFDDGMVMLLGQNFFDDGVHDHAHIDDIATLLEVVLGDVDLDLAIDDALAGFGQTIPIVNYVETFTIIENISWVDVSLTGDLVVTLESVETTAIGPTRVDIDSRTGGLDLDVTMGDAIDKAVDVDLRFAVSANIDLVAYSCSILGCVESLNTTAYGDLSLFSGLSLDGFTLRVHTDISKVASGPMNIAFRDFDIALDTLRVEPIQDVVLSLGVVNLPGLPNTNLQFPLSDLIDLNALIGGFLNPITDLLTTGLPLIVNPLVENLAGPVLEGIFDAVEIDTSFEIPPLLGPKPDVYMLDFYTRLSTATFSDDGGTLGLAAGFYADKGVERDPLGAILRSGCLTGASDALAWGWSPSVGIGLKTDMLNAAFFGAWWSGYLDGPADLGGLAGGSPLPIDDLELDLLWLLPPTLDTCSDEGLGVAIGDLYVVMTGNMLGSAVRVALYADLGFAASFETSAAGMSLRIGELTFSDFEVMEEEAGALGDLFDLRNLVEDGLPAILESFLVGQEFGPFNLPATDLGASIPGLPPGTTVGLGALSITNQDGYIVIGGDLGP